jgi:membrane-bound lytic murein transglycosylase D
MKAKPGLMRLYVGALLLLGSGLTAWSAKRAPVPAESAPMETLLAAEGTVNPAAGSWDLPVTRNERVDDWIGFLQGANGEKTRLWLERSGKYGPMIRAELRRRGMPEDLVYLALIESGFSPRATSSAAAVGIWQFIAETGRRYGLQVTNELDERRDPVKATSAALDYLQDLYDRFGSWYLAAAAYNTGENRVERILRERAGGARGDDSLFWRIAPYLPRETRNYVPLMLAAGHIGKQPGEFGFEEVAYQEPLAFDIAWVPGATDLSLIARAAGVESAVLADLNPHLVRQRTPSGRGWAVRLPQGARTAFTQGFPKLYQEYRLAQVDAPVKQASVVAGRTHRVRRGETLGHIARRYGVSVAALRSANGDLNPRRLSVGRKLVVPGGTATRVAAKASSGPRLHVVRRGENLSVIGKRYQVSVTQLQRWNDLSRRSRIYPGQKLQVRA